MCVCEERWTFTKQKMRTQGVANPKSICLTQSSSDGLRWGTDPSTISTGEGSMPARDAIDQSRFLFVAAGVGQHMDHSNAKCMYQRAPCVRGARVR